jgi:hypothetical protein
MKRPPVICDGVLDEVLAQRPSLMRDKILEYLADRLRPGYRLVSKRTSSSPLSPSLISSLFGASPGRPVLSRTASKFGGSPYFEQESDIPSTGGQPHRFLFQLNFADIGTRFDSALNRLPQGGILTCFLAELDYAAGPLQFRWYPEANENRAAEAGMGIPSCPKYETRIEFRPCWFPAWDDDWKRIVGRDDPEIDEAILDWTDRFYRRNECEGHAIQCWPSWALREQLGADQASASEVLLRFEYDNEAGFAWGSNTVYAVISDSDLEAGRLDRTRSAIANC